MYYNPLFGPSRLRTLLVAALMTLLSWGAAQVDTIPASTKMVLNALNESPGAWADEAIEVVVGRGLYIGYPDGTYGWRDDITRAEMAVVIARLLSAFELDAFNPQEQQALREAVSRLDAELAGALQELTALRRAVEAPDGRLTELAADDAAIWAAIEALALPIEDHEERIRVLEAALLTLRGLAGQEELDAVAQDLERLADLVADHRLLIEALEARLAGAASEVAQADLDALAAEITALRSLVEGLAGRSSGIERRLSEVEVALAGLPVDDTDSSAAIAALRLDLNGLGSSLGAINLDMADLDERLVQLEESHDELVERVDRLEAELLPERAGFYVSLAAMGADPALGLLGKVSVGHDSLLGNIGFRVSYEHAFGAFASNASALATYTTSFGASDAYVGLGGGVSFEADPVLFGEMTLGIGYRLGRHIGLFIEGRYRPYFDGANQQFGGIGGGVQLRF